MKKTSVFVPGKVIIVGEHAVVYGKMALVASISQGVGVQVVERGGTKKTDIVKKAIEVAGGDDKTQVKIDSNLPIGSGLGSSAAVAVAVIKTVRTYLKKPINNDELFSLTMECEKIAHGNASGIDPACVVYGGLIAFRKGQPFERLKIVKPIKLLLVNSGKPEESTKEMVELVALNPDRLKIVGRIEELVEQVKERLVKGEGIADLLNMNGLLLERMGVVGKFAKKLSDELRTMGCSVKITGAGGVRSGSGIMIVMVPDLAKIKKLLDNRKINYFETVIGAK